MEECCATHQHTKVFALLKKHFPDHEIKILSLGTGTYLNLDEHRHGEGSIGWVSPIINAQFQRQADDADEFLTNVLAGNYYRFNTKKLDKESKEMDNISSKNLKRLQSIALEEIQTEQFTNLINFLIE